MTVKTKQLDKKRWNIPVTLHACLLLVLFVLQTQHCKSPLIRNWFLYQALFSVSRVFKGFFFSWCFGFSFCLNLNLSFMPIFCLFLGEFSLSLHTSMPFPALKVNNTYLLLEYNFISSCSCIWAHILRWYHTSCW